MADLSWFTGAGLGLFVHWDHASQQGVEISWPLVGRSIIPGRGEPEDHVTVAQYHASAATFDPQRWDAKALARLARESGASYVVLTVRHHAGYSMYHTRFSDYSIEHSPFQRDITREFVEAVRAEGLRVGLYYSLPDWRHPDYPAFTDADRPYASESYRRPAPEAWDRYIQYLRDQLTELLTGYGPIDLLWFDGEWERSPEEWRAAELHRLIAELQPATVVNDRLPGQGDYSTPEQGLPVSPPAGPWELCLTMSEAWAYRPADTNYKSARRLARYLVETVARGGNLLLNVGPMGDGAVPDTEVALLRELGGWIDTHGESVIGVEPVGGAVDFYGPVTRRGERLYLHLLLRPVEEVVVRGVPVRRIRAVTLLGSGTSLGYETNVEVHEEDHLGREAMGELIIRAPEATGALIAVIAIDLEGEG